MSKTNKMSLIKICDQILEICKNEAKPYKENKEDLLKLYFELEELRKKVGKKEMLKLLKTHKELVEIRNRKASYLENEIMERIIVRLPLIFRFKDKSIPEEVEILQDEYKEQVRETLELSSVLLKYGKEIVTGKDDKSKRSKKRIKHGLRLLDELNRYYMLPGVKEYFWSKIEDKDEDVQFFALLGLENYYCNKDSDKISKEEITRIEKIIKETKSRENASTGCQILIYTEVIDEFGAVIRMDDWKEENWK